MRLLQPFFRTAAAVDILLLGVAALRRGRGIAALGRAASPVLCCPQQSPAAMLGPGVCPLGASARDLGLSPEMPHRATPKARELCRSRDGLEAERESFRLPVSEKSS